MEKNKIIALMQVSSSERDPKWLKDALQAAIQLEHATLPPYLFALWSIKKDSKSNVKKLIKDIAFDEMKHMGLVCNMLTSIGGSPIIDHPDFVPDYPSRLPGGVKPNLLVSLKRLSKDHIHDVFMEIEAPETPLPEPEPTAIDFLDLRNIDLGEKFPSIGEFYQAILDTFKKLSTNRKISFSKNRQIATNLHNAEAEIMDSIEKVEAAINLISEEGEGMSDRADDEEGDLAHYYRFLEIYRGKKWITGEEVKFPTEIYPIVPVPNGGYQNIPASVQVEIVAFNEIYTAMLKKLHKAWNEDNGQEHLTKAAYELMPQLSEKAKDLLESQIDATSTDKPIYGPTFKYISDELGSVPDMNISVIKEIQIFPPLAIARFGSSKEPMHNYDVVEPDTPTGFRKLIPAETFIVNRNDGSIAGVVIPEEMSLRDATPEKNIKPVAPFFELWARFDDDGDFHHLTKNHLEQLGLTVSDIKWSITVANRKMLRRTGDKNDEIVAMQTLLSNHQRKALDGKCNNFKDGASIDLGSVQFIKPTDEFPEIRLRITPPGGKIFGHQKVERRVAGQTREVISEANAVYDSQKGGWDNHKNDDSVSPQAAIPAARIGTVPINIFAIDRELANSQPPLRETRNLGYFDDTCDGILKVEIAGLELKPALARVSVAPPDFAPDSYHVRTVADELKQIALGSEVHEELGAQEVIDVVRRAMETMRLYNVSFYNSVLEVAIENGVEAQVFPGQISYADTLTAHEGILTALEGLKAPSTDSKRQRAVRMLERIDNILRDYREVGNQTRENLQKMPALMRGATARFDLTLSRRQLNTIKAAKEQFKYKDTNEPIPTEDPLKVLIDALKDAAFRHGRFTSASGETLESLFSDPDKVIQYLLSENAKGRHAQTLNIEGEPLVKPGEPYDSAFVKLLEFTSHPMHRAFTNYRDNTGKNGIQIVRDWITNLPTT